MAFRQRPGTESRGASDESETDQRPPKRRATVYDAVAGKVGERGFITSGMQRTGKHTDLKNAATQPLRPDEVLFKQQNAPIRYEEDDYYFANKDLGPDQKLPNSDLLKAIHGYFSKFYARSSEIPDSKVWKSMDETALIAMGILLEETARETLGETGDFAFLEPMEDEPTSDTQNDEPTSSGKSSGTSDQASTDEASDDDS